MLLGHCGNCLALDGCYFIDSKRPENPLHQHCHCNLLNVSEYQVKSIGSAECPIEKFTKYIFAEGSLSKGKKDLFENFGFSISDADYLKKLYETQALEKYISGDYELNVLDNFGQRINIKIVLNGNEINTGWMVEPNGKIRNTTPFGGWI